MNHTYAEMDGNTTIITKAADKAAQKGMLIVSSAGNEAQSSWKYISAPADGDSVLTVGAVNGSGEYAKFSSVGPTSDGRIKPNVAAQGENAIVLTTGDTINYGSGTSFSAPIIAGLAACLWQAHPTKTNMEIIKAIEMSSSQYLTPDNQLGYGIPDFNYAHQLLSYEGASGGDSIIKTLPNPFAETFSVFGYNKNSSQLNYEIIDVSGRLIASGNITLNPENFFYLSFADTEVMKQGVYLMRFIFEDKTLTKKVIKL
jgi:subtilisin family serine protease